MGARHGPSCGSHSSLTSDRGIDIFTHTVTYSTAQAPGFRPVSAPPPGASSISRWRHRAGRRQDYSSVSVCCITTFL